MSTLVYRAVKGAALTNAEIDANNAALNTDKMEKSANLSDIANASIARTNLGLGNVTNTADVDKAISTAQQAALNLKRNVSTLIGQSDLAANVVGNGPAFSAYQTVAQSLSSVPTKLLFQAEEYDFGGCIASSTLTIPISGVWLLCGAIRWGDFSGNNILELRINGSLYRYATQNLANVLNPTWVAQINFTAGDTVELWAMQQVTANTDPVGSSTFFAGHLVRTA